MLLGLFALGLTLGMWAARYVHRSRPDVIALASSRSISRSEAARIRRGTQREFIRKCFVPLVAAALLLTTALYLWWTWGTESPRIANLLTGVGPIDATTNRGAAVDPLDRVASIFGLIRLHRGMVAAFIFSGILVHAGGWLISGRIRHQPLESIIVSISGIIAGTVGLLVGVWFLARPDTPNREILYATLAPPAFLGVMLVGSQLFTALSSAEASDAEREWVTRFNAWLLIAIVMWTTLCALVLYGPQWATEVAAAHGRRHRQRVGIARRRSRQGREQLAARHDGDGRCPPAARRARARRAALRRLRHRRARRRERAPDRHRVRAAVFVEHARLSSQAAAS